MILEHLHRSRPRLREEQNLPGFQGISDNQTILVEIKKFLARSPNFDRVEFGWGGGRSEVSSSPDSKEIDQEIDQMVTVEDAAKILGVSKNQVYKLIRAGRVRAERQITVVSLEDLVEYKQNRWKRDQSKG